MIESPMENYVVSRAKAEGWLVRKVRWIGRRNAPDRLYIKAGRVVFLEHKATGKDARVGQQRELERLQAAGVEAYVVDSISQACRILGLEV